MSYHEEINKLLEHAERFDKWAEQQKKMGGPGFSRPGKDNKSER